MVKGPTAGCGWWGMMVRRSPNRAVLLSPWYIQSVSSSAILGRSFQASRFMVLFWVASVTVPGQAPMHGSRLLLCCAAARLQAAWRAVLWKGGGACWATFGVGLGRCAADASTPASAGLAMAGGWGRW